MGRQQQQTCASQTPEQMLTHFLRWSKRSIKGESGVKSEASATWSHAIKERAESRKQCLDAERATVVAHPRKITSTVVNAQVRATTGDHVDDRLTGDSSATVVGDTADDCDGGGCKIPHGCVLGGSEMAVEDTDEDGGSRGDCNMAERCEDSQGTLTADPSALRRV